ncbi:hypothetical protein M9H77_36748 [Catharanthus roseus]|uniref:Uncharacterized protein n=1 Tax=Catharanthus roseus TaxID=4058 RepID=A0ACB9ZTI0_CATRO|nr:hypothetical protein M9H77_36748 [Catharanthus roseus]
MGSLLINIVIGIVLLLVRCCSSSNELKIGYYEKTCPSAEAIVKNTVRKAYENNDTGIAPALIRLHFHDCFVRGCDASVLLDSTPGNPAEKDSPSNFGVQGFDLIDEAKSKIESQCPNKVSCADILAFAARDAVFIAGGKNYRVPAGRRDGTISSSTDPPKNLPGSFFNITQLRSNFANKGLSITEMVTLTGAHSIGDSHCSAFSKRLYSFNSSSNSSSQDPSIDSTYADFLKSKCPNLRFVSSSGTDPIVPFDPTTPIKLDNNYYKNLKMNKGLLFSDQILWTSDLTRKMVKNYADNQNNFWANKFAAAMVHMGSIEVLTGNQGEIRKNCRVVN